MTCVHVRDELRQLQLTSATTDAYLSHEEHQESIFRCLLMECPSLWVDVIRARQLRFTVICFDRFHGRSLVDEVGSAVHELPESDPVTIEPQDCRSDARAEEVPLLLYCNTHRDGTGLHYEWIRTADSPGCYGSQHAQTAAAPKPAVPKPSCGSLSSEGIWGL